MKAAQKLYEGLNIGSETTGLITYMRTDSVQLSKEAINQTIDFIKNEYEYYINNISTVPSTYLLNNNMYIVFFITIDY